MRPARKIRECFQYLIPEYKRYEIVLRVLSDRDLANSNNGGEGAGARGGWKWSGVSRAGLMMI